MAVLSQDQKKAIPEIPTMNGVKSCDPNRIGDDPWWAVWLLCSLGLDGARYVDTSQSVKVFLGALTRRLQGDQVVGALVVCTGAHRRHAPFLRGVHKENISGLSQAMTYQHGWL